jgi:hypothetical protein
MNLMKTRLSHLTLIIAAIAFYSCGNDEQPMDLPEPINLPPVAKDVLITFEGELLAGVQLSVSYTYTDAEGDSEANTTIQWYRADNKTGKGAMAIDGASSHNYTVQTADEGKCLRVGVTPKAATGTTEGTQSNSAFTPYVDALEIILPPGPTYGVIVSPVTGRKWLDRNLGAPATPAAWNDWINYGDLFQWGRQADGHQAIVRTGAQNTDAVGLYATTTTLSDSDASTHSLFIISATSPFDWRSAYNDNLWQGENGINNPCPPGWRIPTKEEWEAEKLTTLSAAYQQLKLTASGFRSGDGSIESQSILGVYWCSTTGVVPGTAVKGAYTIGLSNTSDIPEVVPYSRAHGVACRCIKSL